MNERALRWTSVIGGAVLMITGCVADTSGTSADLDDALFDPAAPVGGPVGVEEPPRYVPFDAGARDAALGDIPGRDDDRSGVGDVPYDPVDERLPVRCGGASGDLCRADEVCCPATQECVPTSCPGCCPADDYHRFTEFEAPDPESLPDVNPVGPPPGDDGRDGAPEGDPDDPDPGPMPPPPSAP